MEKWRKQYKNIVGYGIGQYYEIVKDDLIRTIDFTYFCDRKFDEEQVKEYDGVPTITRSQLAQLDNSLVVVLVGTTRGYETIKNELESLGVDVIHVDNVIGRRKEIDGKTLKSNCTAGKYEDVGGNSIYFDETLPDNIKICFEGYNNCVNIGGNLVISNLLIRMGNNGICKIGKNTEIVGGKLFVSDAKILIGDDCLFSTDVILRTHDGHHIFDLNTHQRINYSKDIVIGDNVWIGHRVTLLAGAQIGTGSVVGTNAVTSAQFGEYQIIAGSPARCIRENICWSKDNTDYFNRTCLEECKSQEALKYI